MIHLKATIRKALVAAAIATAGAAFAAPTPLTRQQCLEIALRDNPTVLIADMEVKKVNYAKKETLAKLFPQIDFSASYQRSIELQTIRMNMGGESQSLKMGSDNSWNMGFSAQMPLINPTLWKSISISDTQILANLESARTSRIDIIDNVNRAYYALLLANDSREVVRKNHEIAVMNHEVYRKQFEAGTASEYDVLRSSVQVKNLEPELLQADIAVRQCLLQLKVLMGIDVEADIEAAENLEQYRRDMYSMPSAQVPDLNGNTSLRELDIQTRLADKNIDLKKFAWLPTLGASFNLSWMALSNGNAFKNQQFNPYSTVGLQLSVPIFSGGSKYYGFKQAQVQRRELDLQRENLVKSLTMQAELAIDNINREAAQIESSQAGVEQAAKAYGIMQKSFDIGAATYLELRDSELANTQAQLAYLQSIYNYLCSTSELEKLLGKSQD